MGCVIRMNSEKFVMDFLKEFDPKEFQFLLVSENITNAARYKNVMPMQALIPPPGVARAFINEGYGKEYKEKYLNYLKKDEINSLVSIIVKAVMGGMKVVLLCSKSEDDFKYLKLICDFIEDEYKLKTYTLKSFKENPNKATKVKNKDEILHVLAKTMDKLKNVAEKLTPEIDKEKFMKKLSKLDKTDLYKYCKSKGMKVDEDMSKKDLMKKIKKKIFKD